MRIEDLLDVGFERDNALAQFRISLIGQEVVVHHVELAFDHRITDRAGPKRFDVVERLGIAVQLDEPVFGILALLEVRVRAADARIPPRQVGCDGQRLVFGDVSFDQRCRLCFGVVHVRLR